MTISEAIERLTQIRDENGDLELVYLSEDIEWFYLEFDANFDVIGTDTGNEYVVYAPEFVGDYEVEDEPPKRPKFEVIK
jgi:hypothetical protein